MTQKPTYQELEKRIQALEQELEEYKSEQKNGPEQLQKLYTPLFHNLRDGVFIHPVLEEKQPGCFIHVNNAACSMLGYTQEELMQLNPLDLYDENFREYTAEARRQLKEKWYAIFEASLKTKQGEKVFVEVNGNAIKLEDRIYILSVARDITQRKKMEQELREKEEQFRAIFMQSPVAIMIHDKDTGEVISANPTSFEKFNFSSVDELKLDEYWLHPPCSFTDCLCWIHKAVSEGPQKFEWKRVNCNNEVSWDQVHLNSITINGVKRVLATSIDITDRVKAEQALKESEERNRLLSDVTMEGIVIHKNGLAIDLNQSLAKMLRCSREEILNKDIRKFIHDEDRDIVNQNVEKDYVSPYTIRAVRQDGSIFFAELEARNFQMHEQELRVVAVRDVTERKRAEQEKEKLQAQLYQAQKMESVGVLAGGVAHDFNNLLQSISGHVQLLGLDKAEDHPDKKRIESIENSIGRAAELVNKLLFFSRKADTQKKAVDLNQEVQNAVTVLNRTIPKMIDVELDLDKNIQYIQADPVQIELILLNLGSNAADAMPDGGTLYIRTKDVFLDSGKATDPEPGHYILLSVEDTGHGMDEHTLEQIYDPFFTTKEVGQGTGLGLSSVYGVIKAHNGYIYCNSKPGEGSTFKIYWPAMLAVAEESSSEQIRTSPLGGTETILFVDDEQDIREMISEALHSFGYTVYLASSGEEALKHYSQDPPSVDIVVLDLGMPGIGGYKCMEEILKLNPQALVLIASGYSAHDQAREAMDAGAVDYIGKPYQITELVIKLRELLDSNTFEQGSNKN